MPTYLLEKGGARRVIGKAILATMPPFMKLLGLFGTIAMFLVGGGIIAHGIPGLEPWLHHLVASIAGDGFFAKVLDQVLVLILGIAIGFLVILLVKLFGKPVSALWRRARARFGRARESDSGA